MRSVILSPADGLCPTPPASAQPASLMAATPGRWETVLRLHDGTDRGIAARLMDMGVVPGTRVCRLRAGSRGGPLLVRLRGYLLSLGRDEAACVEVTPGPLPPP